MSATEFTAWSFVDNEGTPKTNTFPTAEEALAQLQRQTGEQYSLEGFADRIGWRLARVLVTIEVLAVLTATRGTEK